MTLRGRRKVSVRKGVMPSVWPVLSHEYTFRGIPTSFAWSVCCFAQILARYFFVFHVCPCIVPDSRGVLMPLSAIYVNVFLLPLFGVPAHPDLLCSTRRGQIQQLPKSMFLSSFMESWSPFLAPAGRQMSSVPHKRVWTRPT